MHISRTAHIWPEADVVQIIGENTSHLYSESMFRSGSLRRLVAACSVVTCTFAVICVVSGGMLESGLVPRAVRSISIARSSVTRDYTIPPSHDTGLREGSSTSFVLSYQVNKLKIHATVEVATWFSMAFLGFSLRS